MQDNILPLMAAIDPYLVPVAGSLAALAAVVALLKRRPKLTKAERQHAFNEKHSRVLQDRILAMDPKGNPGRVINYLKKIDPYVFEELILTALERRGLKIERGTSYSGDGGIDGRFYLGGELWLIQAKRYRDFIKAEHVVAFDAVCQQRNARGLFVHTGQTPERLRNLKRIYGQTRIISGDELIKLFLGQKMDISVSSIANITPIEAGRPKNRRAKPVEVHTEAPVLGEVADFRAAANARARVVQAAETR